jgi:hypothetical protein
MTDKNKADQSASHKKTHIHDTSGTAHSHFFERLRLQPVDAIILSDDQARPHHDIALNFLSTSSTPAQAEV